MNRQDTVLMARKHAIRRDVASPDFFEGALMGNGDLGVVVCTRPDAIVLHLGHNDIWDIRIEEGHGSAVGTFDEIWSRIRCTPGDVHEQDWYRQYVDTVTASYHDYIYPRPYPASSVYLFFDRKRYEVLGHELDISRGLLTVALEDVDGKRFYAQIVVSMKNDALWCRITDERNAPAALFTRMLIAPHKPDGGLPDYQALDNGFIQMLPYNGFEGNLRPGLDKGFSVLYRLDGRNDGGGLDRPVGGVSEIALQVTEGFYDQVASVTAVDSRSFSEAAKDTEDVWLDYWRLSGVALEDEFLEHIWYVNTYFLRCLLNGHSRCPGLFGNWMYGRIGTAWHGDYHMNYNTQQVFWGLMGANRQALHLPYLRMTEGLLPVSKAWAQDFYGLDGACFPHSAYPVPMTVMPYPSPDWGWEIFETPWTVQSLWWHYTYTQDKRLLRDRIYPLMREAALFLTGYMTREGGDPVGDGKFHLFPTIVPELYGLSEGFRLNLDGAVDLAFTKFLFRAMLQAIQVLGLEAEEEELACRIRRILAAYPDYPTAPSRWGEVYVSVQNEDPDHVIYNCPANLMQVFPGEDTDAQSADADALELARNSWRHHYNEGGNDLVFYHMIGARLGLLDVEKFKRHIRYCLLPNETATDRVTLTGGRYPDDIDMDFMARMGIWVENFSLYAVIDECLMWGHTDTIELFPNWDKRRAAAFCSLRAKGAFLVDAACEGGRVTQARVTSECGGLLKLKNPWGKAIDQKGRVYQDPTILIALGKGESVLLTEDG
ncbi:MAG: hypothetical protein J5998_03400 [Clostridia bacterium]|nr:hypothetical protein [Clostridia bacterium]